MTLFAMTLGVMEVSIQHIVLKNYKHYDDNLGFFKVIEIFDLPILCNAQDALLD